MNRRLWWIGLIIGPFCVGQAGRADTDLECGYGAEGEGAPKPAIVTAAPPSFYRSGTIRALVICGKLQARGCG